MQLLLAELQKLILSFQYEGRTSRSHNNDGMTPRFMSANNRP